MKRVAVAIGLLALGLAAPVSAQNGHVRANIPFQFRAGNQLLPAGEYTVRIDSAFQRMTIESTDSQARLVLSTLNTFRGAGTAACRLLFHKYGPVYFLREVWDDSTAHGHELARSDAEREMARISGREMAVVRLRPR